MADQLIQRQDTDGITVLLLNRPEKRNAINDELRGALIDTLEAIQADHSVRALILTGAGPAFCAGGDVAAMQKRFDIPAGEIAFSGWSRQLRVHYAQSLLHNLPIPTIAAVNGPAAGLGADMALACDFVIAADNASFAWSYIHRGLVPDGGGMYSLPRRTGLSRAKELIFTGRRVDAAEALHLGIADRVALPSELLASAKTWAAELSKGSRTALALGKSILNQSLELSAEQISALGSQAQGICYTSTEHRESVAAFLQKSAALEPVKHVLEPGTHAKDAGK